MIARPRSPRIQSSALPCRIEQLEPRALLSAGQLDPTFGQGGALPLDPPLVSEGGANAVVIQGDGDVLVGGGFFSGAIARYRPDGTTDTHFGNNGAARLTFPGDNNGTWQAIALQSDGKIVAGGWYFSGDHQVNAIARFNADGSLDTTFGGGGPITIPFPSGTTGIIAAVAIDPASGKIIFAGSAPDAAGHTDMAFARYDSAGNLDTTFGQNGFALVSIADTGKPNSAASGMVIQSDGRIVAGGTVSDDAGNADFGLARLNADGTPDASFNGSGQAVVDFFGGGDRLQAIDLGPGGTITAVGYAAIPQPGQPDLSSERGFAIARFTAAGQLDTTFNGTGKITTAGTTSIGTWNAVKVLTDGTILAVGSNESETAWIATRFEADGTPDPTFGQGGTYTRDFGSASNFFSAVAIQTDGDIVLGGERIYDDTLGGSISDFALTRLNPDGSTDTGFGPDGLVQGRWPGFFGSFSAVAAQGDGKILAAGPFAELQSAGAPQDAAGRAIVRFNADGTLDHSFGVNGVAILPANSHVGFPHAIHAITVLADGGILVVGTANLSDQTDAVGDFYVARLLPDGRADTDFGGGGAALVDLGGTEDATAVTVGSDGSIILAGLTQAGAGPINTAVPSDIGLARLTAAGRLDTNFGTGGKVIQDFGGDEGVVGVGEDAAGNVLVAFNGGTTGGAFTPYVARFSSTGALDNGYGISSLKGNRAAAGPANSTVRAMAVLADGSAVVAGGSAGAFFVNELNSAGAQQAAFGSGVSVKFGGPTEATALALQSDGKIIAAGSVVSGPSRIIGVTRITADGQVDTTYGNAGKMTASRPEGTVEESVALVVDPQGRAVVASAIDVASDSHSFPILLRFQGDNAPGSISGTVFNDLNHNGVRDTGEPPLAGWTVYTDKNDNGTVDPGEFTAISGVDGSFTISNLPVGTYHIREVPQDGLTQSEPAGAFPQGFYGLTVGAGQAITAQDFGNFLTIGGQTPTPTPTPTLSTTVVSHLPSAVVGGQKIRGSVTVVLTNQGDANFSGLVTINLSVSSDANLDAADTAVVSITKRIKLKHGKSQSVKINLKKLPVVTDGNYRVLAQVQPKDGTAGVAAAATPVSIASPFVDPAALSVQTTETVIAPGKKVAALLFVENQGNITATGRGTVTLKSTGDAGDRTLAAIPVKLNLKPGRSQRLKLRLAIPTDLPAGIYHLIASLDAATLGDNNAGNDAVTSFTTFMAT